MILLTTLAALIQVVLIDIAMSADNALAIGVAASGLPEKQRHGAVIGGIISATLLRIAFAVFAVQLMQIAGLLVAGGLLLLWVAWKLYGDIKRRQRMTQTDAPAENPANSSAKTLQAAILQIVIADISLSLDNVLAVAGVARDHWLILAAGLALSVMLMGLASALVARLTARHAWVGYLGVAVVIYTAGHMIWDGVRALGY